MQTLRSSISLYVYIIIQMNVSPWLDWWVFRNCQYWLNGKIIVPYYWKLLLAARAAPVQSAWDNWRRNVWRRTCLMTARRKWVLTVMFHNSHSRKIEEPGLYNISRIHFMAQETRNSSGIKIKSQENASPVSLSSTDRMRRRGWRNWSN